MKHVRYVLAATALLAAAACSQAGGITSPDSAAPRMDGGFIGSDAVVGGSGSGSTNGVTSSGGGATLPGAPSDSTQDHRGGFIGSDA